MRVLVTGGAGFIGSNLVNALLSGGHAVGVIDDLSTGKAENLHPHAWFRTLDILDPAMPAAVAEFAPDAVVHLAAQASVAVSLARPRARPGGQRRGHARRRPRRARGRCGPRHLGVVGRRLRRARRGAAAAPRDGARRRRRTRTAAPSSPPRARSPRSCSARGVDFASFRFANVYGPRQDAAGEGGVVALFCAAHARRPSRRCSTAPATRRATSSTSATSSARSWLRSSPRGRSAPRPATRPRTTSRPARETSVNDLLRSLREISEYWGPVDAQPGREGDIDRSSLSRGEGRAGRSAGTARQNLDNGLAITWRWFAASS